MIKRIGLALCGLVLLISCKKDNPTVDPPSGSGAYVQYGTPVDSVPSTVDLRMYEVNLRAFSAAGTFAGVTNRMDHIKDLGINAVWLMPIYPIGQINSVNSPYCVKDYKAVNAEYGSLANLRTLVDAAHARGMVVMLDWVANHTSWDNAWVTAHPDWYTQDANGNITIPAGTNWNDVADLNYDNAAMRLAMIEAMKYWALEANIDGFRCDYADGVPYDFWKQTIDSLRALPGRSFVFLAEGTRADHYTAGFDMTYSWDFYTSMKNVFTGSAANTLYTTSNSEYASMPAGKQKLRFTTNHDQSAWEATPITLFNGVAGATVASVVTTYLKGVPLIYTGQEVGRTALVPFFSNSPIDWTANATMRTNYENFMQFYASSITARRGYLTTFSNTDVACFQKYLNPNKVVVIANLRNTTVNYTIPSNFQNTTFVNALTGETVSLGTTLSLTAYQYLVLKN